MFEDLRARSIACMNERIEAVQSGNFLRILQSEIQLNECRYELLRFTCKKSYLPDDLLFLAKLGLRDEPIPDEFIKHKFCDCLKIKEPSQIPEDLSETEEPVQVQDDSNECATVGTPALEDVCTAEDRCHEDNAVDCDAKSCKDSEAIPGLAETLTTPPADVTGFTPTSDDEGPLFVPRLVEPEAQPGCSTCDQGVEKVQEDPSDGKDVVQPVRCTISDDMGSPNPGPNRRDSEDSSGFGVLEFELDASLQTLELGANRRPHTTILRRGRRHNENFKIIRQVQSHPARFYSEDPLIEQVLKLIKQAPSRRAARLVRYTFDSIGSRTRESDLRAVRCLLRLLSE